MTDIAASSDEYLENGYETATPDGDNLLLDFARGEANAFGELIGALGGRVVELPEYGVHLRDGGIPTPFGNAALLTRPVPDGKVDGLVAGLREFFAGTAGGPYMLFSPWPLADLPSHGFARVGHPLSERPQHALARLVHARGSHYPSDPNRRRCALRTGF